MADALGQAGSGAATGAAIGSVIPGVGTVIGGAVGAIAGLLGGIFGGADREHAQELLKQAYDEINKTGAPPELANQIIMQRFQNAGMYTPELEQAVNLGFSKQAEIQEDPSLRNAQNEALQLIGTRARTGLTPEDRAAFNQLRREAAQQAQGKQQAILQQMQARGLAGSGAELAAQLSSSQSQDQDLSAQGDRLAAAASQNALQALSQYSNASQGMRGQDFDIAQAKAAAEDDFSKFNTQNQINRQQRNVASQNQGQQYNLGNKQDIMNQNTNVANQEMAGRVGQQQQDWLNKLQYAKEKAGQLKNQADAIAGNNASATQTAQQWTNIGGGVAGLAGLLDQSGRASNGATRGATTPAVVQNDTSGMLNAEDDRKRKALLQGINNQYIA